MNKKTEVYKIKNVLIKYESMIGWVVVNKKTLNIKIIKAPTWVKKHFTNVYPNGTTELYFLTHTEKGSI